MKTADYASPENKLALKYPADWKSEPSSQPGGVINFVANPDDANDLYTERFNVVVLDMKQEADVNELVNQIKSSLPGQIAGYTAVSDEKTFVADVPARKLVGDVPAQGATVRTAQWMFVVGDKLYVLSSTWAGDRQEKYQPIVQAIVDSVTIR